MIRLVDYFVLMLTAANSSDTLTAGVELLLLCYVVFRQEITQHLEETS